MEKTEFSMESESYFQQSYQPANNRYPSDEIHTSRAVQKIPPSTSADEGSNFVCSLHVSWLYLGKFSGSKIPAGKSGFSSRYIFRQVLKLDALQTEVSPLTSLYQMCVSFSSRGYHRPEDV